jgi:hypothetical protein
MVIMAPAQEDTEHRAMVEDGVNDFSALAQAM